LAILQGVSKHHRAKYAYQRVAITLLNPANSIVAAKCTA
jgi:hypothetical protein